MKGNENRFYRQILFFIGTILLVVGFTAAFNWVFRTDDIRLYQAEESYRKGEASLTIAASQESFNAALTLLLQLEKAYHPNLGSGKLSYDIGNAYFQLREYPLAIFYYMRAEKLMPRSEEVKKNLFLARNKIGLKSKEDNFFDVLLLRNLLSLSERLQLFFVLALLTLLISSIWIWEKTQWLSTASLICLIPAAALLILLGISYYFSPIEAILIHGAELRKDAGMEFDKVGEKPILGGTFLEVVSIIPNGKWLKVVLPNGSFGYLPSEAVKIVD